MEIIDHAGVLSSTFAEGDAGQVSIHAGSLRMQGYGPFSGIKSHAQSFEGSAGSVLLTVDGLLELLDGAVISGNTWSDGDAGGITIHAGDLRIDNRGVENRFTGILSSAEAGSGNAGAVKITVDRRLEILKGAAITSGTWSAGDAGSVMIEAGELVIDGAYPQFTGVACRAEQEAAGGVGNVKITADDVSIRNQGHISIGAGQTLTDDQLAEIPEAMLRVNAGRLHLDTEARITAESAGNVPAAPVYVTAAELVVENGARITTSSVDTDGGPITIEGETVFLRDGLVTTSVEGTAGDGGNISVSGRGGNPADVLVFDGGFVQANTAAAGARGGDIYIDAGAVIAEGGKLAVGGAVRQTFEPGSDRNIIQAAAPGGEQGTIRVTAPELDISAALLTIVSGFAESVQPLGDPCRIVTGRAAGSLVLRGHGGMPASPDKPAVVSFDERRLEELASPK